MKIEPILSLSDMPFCIGAFDQPSNPHPLPNTLALNLCVNETLGRLELATDPSLESLLEMAYSLGVEMGTPSDDTDLGKPYVMDFLDFVDESIDHKGKVLEIGAGVGFLSRLLAERGWEVESIEPGKGYQGHWEKHQVKVINEFFPTPAAVGPYDLIIFYTVLEHIKNTESFLQDVASHLKPGGKIVLSVPDCSLEIDVGDPSMLVHEHYQYFTPRGLERTLRHSGLQPSVRASRFGRSIYASAVRCEGEVYEQPVVSEEEISCLYEYAERVSLVREKFQKEVATLLKSGSVGVYCPGRAIALLPQDRCIRLFDDSQSLHGRFYPPFESPIESRSALLGNPPDVLYVMSRTFGEKLKRELATLLRTTRIILIEELFGRTVE